MSERLTYIERRLKALHSSYLRLHQESALFLSRFDKPLSLINLIIGTLAVFASVACIVILVVYLGYDLSSAEAQTLKRTLRIIQVIFACNILYKLIFRFHSTVFYSRILRWIVDAGVLVSLLFWMRHDHTTGLQPLWLSETIDLLHGPKFLFIALGCYSIVELCYGLSRIPSRRTNPSLLMATSFALLIIIGSFVLMLPRCTYHGISYFDSLFVAASAVSITGLTSVDLPSTFTPFGLIVLSVLIQLGGLGIITFTSFFALFFTGNTSIYNQLLLRDIIYSKSMNMLVPTLLYVLGFTLTIELIGAVCVYFTIPEGLGMATDEKLIFCAFHSMSSFCNAGFSCLPDGMSNPVLMQSDQWIYIVTSVLVFAGGIGFPLLVNLKAILKSYLLRGLSHTGLVRHYKEPVHIFDLNTKIVLYTTLTVLLAGSVLFYLFERHNTLSGMSGYQQAVQSVFNSLTPRSAGFASVNPADFLNITLLLVMVQMIIGGASQSMAGGIKVNTLGAVLLNLKSVLLGHEGTTAFGRTLNRASVRRANGVVIISLCALTAYAMIMLWTEPGLRGRDILFETVSALFTVGSSLGITSELSDVSKVVLSTAMFIGRVGILSLLTGLVKARHDISEHLPVDNIIIN